MLDPDLGEGYVGNGFSIKVGRKMIYGAKAPNYVMSEMSLLYNDVMFCKKYLQQKKYRVTLTGKQYIFLTATKIL